MSRTTIDFGIDLGTTNSAVAVLKGIATEIIKNNSDADVTPSAVSIDKKGVVHVGQRAKNKSTEHGIDVHLEFKRQVGTHKVYEFKNSGLTRTAEELSAEILKSLRADVQQRIGEEVEASVITVPAAFELHQCDATRKAAQLAGFKETPLLQEPVAAALAYGFQVDKEKAYWLVYDFGGGTFDAAIIKSEEGSIHVVNHGGDNHLGGSDLDWAIVEQILAPRIVAEFNLPEFRRGNERWRPAFAKLKRAAEVAKIDLSRAERTVLESCVFLTNDGKEIEFECDLSRNDVLRVAEPIILRSIEICKRVLEEKGLRKDDIERVILVGGPTLSPYFRELIAESLQIPLDHSVDPLTVVARGAAVFAGTQRLSMRLAMPIPAEEYSVDLKHKTVGIDSSPMVGGKVSGGATESFSGFTLELVNTKSKWRSGKISLMPDGVFIANLHAERGERNIFAIELYDASGSRRKITPDTLSYTIGAVIEEQPLINSMGIALANNEYDRLFEKGRGLPLKATRDYRTIHPIRQGQSGELIKIPIIEGEQELADRNRHVDDLFIEAVNIRRDLPAGSEVEVTLRIDESRIISVTAYVPLLDEEFSKKVELRHRCPDYEFLKKDFEKEMRRFREIKSKATSTKGETVEGLVEQIEASHLMYEVKNALAASNVDSDAAAKCEKRLLELKLKFDEAANAIEWPALKKEAQDGLNMLQMAAEKHGNEEERQRYVALDSEIREIIRECKSDRLRKRIEEMIRLYFDIVTRQPGWWVYQFRKIEKDREKIKDQARAARLLDQGRDCLVKNNFTGLQNVVSQLLDLLPEEEVQAVQRGYESGVVR